MVSNRRQVYYMHVKFYLCSIKTHFVYVCQYCTC